MALKKKPALPNPESTVEVLCLSAEPISLGVSQAAAAFSVPDVSCSRSLNVDWIGLFIYLAQQVPNSTLVVVHHGFA